MSRISSPASAERPFFLIIAGPNGSGKSSTYQSSDVEIGSRAFWIINPDLLTARIQQVEGLDLRAANLQAVKRIEVWLEASIDAHQTVGVETVLSTGKYRRLVARAKSLGFEFRLIYVILDAPARNVERVRLRVSKGGHDVPEERILARHARSIAQMPWFCDQADQAWFYDNSSSEPRLVGTKAGATLIIDENAPVALHEAFDRRGQSQEPPRFADES